MAGREQEETVRRPATVQRWRALTFLHWRYDPASVQRLLPAGLEVDTWDGSAWVSLTPFLMVDIRIGNLPPVPTLSTFPETNVRTYVRGPDGRDGLWFFSLEADSLPLVLAARSLYGVPYRWAEMSVEERGDTIRYRSRRRSGRRGGGPVGHDIVVRPERPCDPAPEPADWLSGRWRAYSSLAGRLAVTPVEHDPWPLWTATLVSLEQSLLAAGGLPEPDGEPLVYHSPGVDVRLGVPRLVPRAPATGVPDGSGATSTPRPLPGAP
jgi:uncharacterized protein YqjF (DUF2071 family)